MNNSFCKTVLPIPQYNKNCWFTAILMCLLKSQYSRKLLINNLNVSSKSSKLVKIIYKLLLNTYIANPKIYEYYKNFDLNKLIKYFIEDKNIIEHIIENGGVPYIILPLLIKSLKLKSLSLFTFNEDPKKKIYNGYYKFLAYMTKYIDIYPSYDYYKNYIEREIRKKINPDYIFITYLDNKILLYESRLLELCRINNFRNIKYDKKIKELKSFTLNDNYYELDSCILSNYNGDDIDKRHAIAGIKCKNKNYVYNGWISATKDPAMKKRNINNTPCELFEHDWEFNKTDFCLNAKLCKLDIPNPNDLCFSFGKGDRTYIFVKSNKKYKSIDKNKSITSTELNDDDKYEKYNSDDEIYDDTKEKKLCKEWMKNKNINPETKRTIKDTSPIYKKYVKLCTEPLIKDLCMEWLKNKNINPETNRKIKDTSPIYKKYMKKCSKK